MTRVEKFIDRLGEAWSRVNSLPFCINIELSLENYCSGNRNLKGNPFIVHILFNLAMVM